MHRYLLHGKLTARDGSSDALAAILLQAAELMATANGCRLYTVGRDDKHPEAVWVTEIWDDKASHEASLSVEGVRELIGKAMPLLAEPPQRGQEITVWGGHLVTE